MLLTFPSCYVRDHKWTKKIIFWDLPYWATYLIRHNLDVMYIEKNLNARRDLKIICNCPELELDERRPNVMPKAVYTLMNEQKRRICEWIRDLKFLDGYASNLVHCIDMTQLWIHGMKSHDCHVFMWKLMLIAFREMLPEHV
ncbi:UNVERIFIED_CONTAM: hypothetical protein Sindi_0423300 [Sesamum indicum]